MSPAAAQRRLRVLRRAIVVLIVLVVGALPSSARAQTALLGDYARWSFARAGREPAARVSGLGQARAGETRRVGTSGPASREARPLRREIATPRRRAPRLTPQLRGGGLGPQRGPHLSFALGSGSATDTAASLALHTEARGAPFVALELRANAVHEPALATATTRLYRAHPEILFGLTPVRGMRLIAGAGVGPAYTVDEACTGSVPGPCLDASRSKGFEVTRSATLGTQFDWHGLPVSTMLRADGISSNGWSALFTVGVDIGR